MSQQEEPLQPTSGNDRGQVENPFSRSDVDEKKPRPAFAQRFGGHRPTNSNSGSYVSPSDNIMSPASAKLNAFKEKRFSKSAKPRTLFATTNTLSSAGTETTSTSDQK